MYWDIPPDMALYGNYYTSSLGTWHSHCDWNSGCSQHPKEKRCKLGKYTEKNHRSTPPCSSHLPTKWTRKQTKSELPKWKFLEIGVSLHHPFDFRIFHELNHPASVGYPHDYGKPQIVLQHTSWESCTPIDVNRDSQFIVKHGQSISTNKPAKRINNFNIL